jgi:hypothetical protein
MEFKERLQLGLLVFLKIKVFFLKIVLLRVTFSSIIPRYHLNICKDFFLLLGACVELFFEKFLRHNYKKYY